jgi:Na+/H+ antiporter NhaD/arsenite permease-like protein
MNVPVWSVLPFALLLLCIAMLPLVAGKWWHHNYNKAIVVALFAIPVAIYLIALNTITNGESVNRLLHELGEYFSFIVLLTALYTISGGILVSGDIRARPFTNLLILAGGAVLSNFIGTTGASMLLIRPFLQINSHRRRVAHLPVFFIFIVSNVGGLLTPLGDPPLFLGFLKGVDFFWTMTLWKEWLTANLLLLLVFYFWDKIAYALEPKRDLVVDRQQASPLTVQGMFPNVLLLVGVLLCVLLQSPSIRAKIGLPLLDANAGKSDEYYKFAFGGVMIGLALLSLLLTKRGLRAAHKFTWGPIAEVAILFLGIFVTMVPALAILELRGGEFGVTKPWEFFWLTGGLSSFLDNAPTYVTFATLAAGQGDLSGLAQAKPLLLRAISCGAIFMGANTYIGNGPNFMVKAIADEAGYKTPSFFGYMLYSGFILIPIFLLITAVFFL